jgi:hypothetical protein
MLQRQRQTAVGLSFDKILAERTGLRAHRNPKTKACTEPQIENL